MSQFFINKLCVSSFVLHSRTIQEEYLICPVFKGMPKLKPSQIQLASSKVTKLKNEKYLQCWKSVLNLTKYRIDAYTHRVQCFQLSTAISNQIDKSSRDLFSKKPEDIEGLPMVSWKNFVDQRKQGNLDLGEWKQLYYLLKEINEQLVP